MGKRRLKLNICWFSLNFFPWPPVEKHFWGLTPFQHRKKIKNFPPQHSEVSPSLKQNQFETFPQFRTHLMSWTWPHNRTIANSEATKFEMRSHFSPARPRIKIKIHWPRNYFNFFGIFPVRLWLIDTHKSAVRSGTLNTALWKLITAK